MKKQAKAAAPKQPARAAQGKRKTAARVAKVAYDPAWSPLARAYADAGLLRMSSDAPGSRAKANGVTKPVRDIGIVGYPTGGRSKAKP